MSRRFARYGTLGTDQEDSDEDSLPPERESYCKLCFFEVCRYILTLFLVALLLLVYYRNMQFRQEIKTVLARNQELERSCQSFAAKPILKGDRPVAQPTDHILCGHRQFSCKDAAKLSIVLKIVERNLTALARSNAKFESEARRDSSGDGARNRLLGPSPMHLKPEVIMSRGNDVQAMFALKSALNMTNHTILKLEAELSGLRAAQNVERQRFKDQSNKLKNALEGAQIMIATLNDIGHKNNDLLLKDNFTIQQLSAQLANKTARCNRTS